MVVSVRNIVTIESARNDVVVRLNNGAGKFTVRGSIVRCVERLPPDLFFLISRGYLVNLLHVAKVDASMRNIRLTMKDDREISMSRKQSIRFRRQLAL